MDDDDLIPPAWVAQVQKWIKEYEAQLEREPGNLYATLCLAGWQRELERLEEGRIY